jgi:hypothetical protein
MNLKSYEKWSRQILIPNHLPNSVLETDNAPNQNKHVNSAPTSSSRRSVMTLWLMENRVPFGEKILKPDLYQLIKVNKLYTAFTRLAAF